MVGGMSSSRLRPLAVLLLLLPLASASGAEERLTLTDGP